MRVLNCFVLPSLAEGISNTILEAMASGLPVVATAVGGNADLVEHGRTGHIVASDDVVALTSAIVSLACNPQAANLMGQQGRYRVEQNFSMGAMVKAYQSTYDRLLKRGSTTNDRS
jgi:glycosyltransferase involved in cell wall biosynthesis